MTKKRRVLNLPKVTEIEEKTADYLDSKFINRPIVIFIISIVLLIINILFFLS